MWFRELLVDLQVRIMSSHRSAERYMIITAEFKEPESTVASIIFKRSKFDTATNFLDLVTQ